MTKHWMMMLSALCMFAACSKEPEQRLPAKDDLSTPKTVTLTATLPNPGTKVSYSEEGYTLKGSWDGEEELSVVVYTGSEETAQVKSVTNYSYSGPAGQKSVDFNGDALELDPGDKVWVIYPAVKDVGDGSKWKSDFKGRFGSPLVQFDKEKYWYLHLIAIQSANNDYSHVSQSVVFYSDACTVDSEGNISVTLQPVVSVLKINVTLPASAAGKKVSYLAVNANYNKLLRTSPLWVKMGGWDYIGNYAKANYQGLVEIMFGSWANDNQRVATGIPVPDDRKLTVYLPFLPIPALFGPGGVETLTLTFYKENYDSSLPHTDAELKENTVATINKTFTSTKLIEAGAIYRMDVGE